MSIKISKSEVTAASGDEKFTVKEFQEMADKQSKQAAQLLEIFMRRNKPNQSK